MEILEIYSVVECLILDWLESLLLLLLNVIFATESESYVFQTDSDSSHPLGHGDHGENPDETVRKRYGDKEVPYLFLTFSSHCKQIIFLIAMFILFARNNI